MQALMGAVHDFRGLFDKGKRCADRGVLLALTDLDVGRGCQSAANFLDVLNKAGKRGPWLLVGQGHNGILDTRDYSGIDSDTGTWRHSEGIRILSSSSFGKQESGEVPEHSGVNEESPGGR